MSSALSSYEEERYTKAEADYRPKDDGNKCGTCAMFMPEDRGVGRCQIVMGDIDPEYVCDYYEPDRVDNKSGTEATDNTPSGRKFRKKPVKLVPNKEYYTGKLMD